MLTFRPPAAFVTRAWTLWRAETRVLARMGEMVGESVISYGTWCCGCLLVEV